MIDVTGAGDLRIGQNSRIGEGVRVIFNRPATVTIGDYCTLGDGTKLVVNGDVEIDDWVSIHDNGLVLSTAGVRIGQHCWFGQNTVIDGTGGMAIGNGVRVGMFSQLWSHAAAGEQLEGCTLFAERPVTIAHDVWLVGSCIVASGVALGERLVALIGSNITKSFPDNVTIAGVPAAIRPGLSFYKAVDLDTKMQMLSDWLSAASSDLNVAFDQDQGRSVLRVRAPSGGDSILFVRSVEQAKQARDDEPHSTVCCVEDKSYSKQLTPLEWSVLKYLSGNKARFLRLQ
jgi:acetyltransferase-like isoleucine patch superfamily enzyme